MEGWLDNFSSDFQNDIEINVITRLDFAKFLLNIQYIINCLDLETNTKIKRKRKKGKQNYKEKQMSIGGVYFVQYAFNGLGCKLKSVLGTLSILY